MTERAIALAFFDRGRGLYGIARPGGTVVLSPGKPASVLDGAELAAEADGYHAKLQGRFDLTFAPLTEASELAGSRTTVCRVSGDADGKRLECLGTATETANPPAWAELDAVRSVSALFDEGHAVLASASRPRGAAGHGEELVVAHFLSAGRMLGVEEARISTVYDGEGRQRTAGLELWLPAEDFPRRASGTAIAGTSLAVNGLVVNLAVFDWRMEGREGAGAYDLTVRPEAPAAA